MVSTDPTTRKYGGDAGERSLGRLRAKKHWSLQHAATLLEVDASTLNRWEHGKTFPRGHSVEKLCRVYECSEEELGLPNTTSSQVSFSPPALERTTVAQSFLVSDPTMRLLSLAFSPLDTHMMQWEVIKLLEGYPMNTDALTRREALRRLATLPMITLHLNAFIPTQNALPEAVLSQCSAGVVACWYLRKGKELSFAESTVSTYLPTLREIVASSSQHRKAAADVLVQCYLLKAALSWHITSPMDGIKYTQQAEAYSQIAESPLLQVAALRSQAAVFCYANQWGQALHAGLQAKQILERTPKDLIPPLARSYVYAGVATYQAYHQHKQDAFTSLKKAHATFFEQSGDDVVPLWIDHNIGNLLMNDGLTHSHLGLYESAVDSFAQIEQRATNDATITFDGTIEAAIEQTLAEVSRDDGRDMEKCIRLWTQGMKGATSIQSNKLYTDALITYTAMKAAWPGESRIKELREYTTHW
jgi:transcriptional regulator with XRE-family HTH domain